jgi:hypothetical protein
MLLAKCKVHYSGKWIQNYTYTNSKHFESRTSLENYMIPLAKDLITANTMIRYSFSHSTLETEAANLPETLTNQPTTTRFLHPQQET